MDCQHPLRFQYYATNELQYYFTMLDYERRVNLALAELVQNLQHQLDESRASLGRAVAAVNDRARRQKSFQRLSEDYRKLTLRVLEEAERGHGLAKEIEGLRAAAANRSSGSAKPEGT
jgi:predicted RNase H-like nuclease (RuvC/YqgF family)